MELSELLQSANIVDYISQYVDLEQRGDEWWGLSCFKDEKTPSFSVREDPPVFYDYSSGIGGNLYTFIRFYDRCSSREAIEKLKAYVGFEGKIDAPRTKMNATKICKKYTKQKKTLKQSKASILPDNYMDKFEDRYDALDIWRREGISDESMQKFQVKYDAFSNRIVYPIRNINGKIVNVGGRTVDPCWKEKGLKKYCYFQSWGTMDTIYGLSENMEHILIANEVILFEGCKSVLIADTWGIRNTGAILTSHLNPHQLRILAQMGCRVVFALDKDVDVRKDHNIQKLKHYVNVEYIHDKDGVLGEKDSPVDKGCESFVSLYETRKRLF